MTYIEINNTRYRAAIRGYERDRDWDNRDSKAITLEMSYVDAIATFVDDIDWSIVYQENEIVKIYDNSEYSIAGPITDNRDGTVTVKMGKPTADDILAVIMGG